MHLPERRPPSARRDDGFTYIGMLFAVILIGLALSAVGTLWSAAVRRDREAALLWTGAQYQRAIQSYVTRGPGGLRQFPQALEELLEDRRGPVTLRHLRRLYGDPVTGATDWTVVRLADGSISGVRSAALGKPLKQAGFPAEQAAFAGAQCYCDWAFVYVPSRPQGSATAP